MFQGQCARSKRWFDTDVEWIEENLSTREPQFYKRPFQTNIEGQYGITYPIFLVLIGNAKETGEIERNIQATMVAYHQNASKSC